MPGTKFHGKQWQVASSRQRQSAWPAGCGPQLSQRAHLSRHGLADSRCQNDLERKIKKSDLILDERVSMKRAVTKEVPGLKWLVSRSVIQFRKITTRLDKSFGRAWNHGGNTRSRDARFCDAHWRKRSHDETSKAQAQCLTASTLP